MQELMIKETAMETVITKKVSSIQSISLESDDFTNNITRHTKAQFNGDSLLRGSLLHLSSPELVQRENEIASIHLSKLGTESKLQKKLLRYFDKYFYLVALALVIPAAAQWPIGHNEGFLYPRITCGWIVTIIVFFGIGLGIKIAYLKRACLFWQMNLFCHIIIFVYFPLMGYLIKLIAMYLVPDDMVSKALLVFTDGTIILCCLPATAASAVVLTHNAHGNEAAAAINCTMANLIGIFLTPLLILSLMEITGDVDVVDTFMELGLKVIAPFFLAQLIRIAIGRKGTRKLKIMKVYIRKINEVALLFMVFCAFSESFYTGMDASTADVATIICIIVVLHCISYPIIWYLASLTECCMAGQATDTSILTFSIYDRIGMMYSGISKTIALGIPLIEVMYGGDSNIGMYLVPVLLYKPVCLIAGSILVEPFRRMVRTERSFFVSMTSTKENRAAYDTFISNLTDQTDYGALEAVDLNTLSDNMLRWDPNDPTEKVYAVDRPPALARLAMDGWAADQSNYITLVD